MISKEKAEQLYIQGVNQITGDILSHINEIYPGEVYAGSQPRDGYQYPEIKAVLNLQAENFRTLTAETILWMPIVDGDDFRGVDWLEIAVEYIEKCVELERPILVHCAAGVSRTALVIVAYVMKREGLGLEEAWKFARKRRPMAPNINFLVGLSAWEDHLTKQP